VEIPFDSVGNTAQQVYFVLDTGQKVLDGPYMAFFLNGETSIKGQYTLGVPFGTWTFFYESGKVKIKTIYDSLTGQELWVYFFEKGKIQRSGPVVEGKKEGLWNYYYESGGKKEFGRYARDIREGTWKYFYEDGTLKAQALFSNGFGWYEDFFPSGNKKMEGWIREGKSDSSWVYYYQDGGILAKGRELEGKKTGFWQYFYPDGSVKSEGDYVTGLKTGPWRHYYVSGTLQSEGSMQEDVEQGYWKMYYQDGSTLGEGEFEAGTGKYREYFPNGKIKIEGSKKEGKYEGTWFYYYEEGPLEGKAEFQNGEGKYVGFYPDGRNKMSGDLKNGEKVGVWELYNPDGSLAGTFEKIEGEEEPIYEPVLEEADEKELVVYAPPKSKFKFKTRRGWKYFTPRMNEYRSFILSANPIATFFGSFPIALEYYYQERLGYEVFLSFLRFPFYSSKGSVPEYKTYNRGIALALRQKMYFDLNLYGLLYFGHELRYTRNNYFINVSLEENISFTPTIEQNQLEYSIIFGDRVFQSIANRGFTLDVWAGIGIGYRISDKNWNDNSRLDDLFGDVNQNSISVPIRLGVTLGYMFKYNPSPLYQTK
jgi:antitoxin component YwqK of YwqJK toxin-antitoxin module